MKKILSRVAVAGLTLTLVLSGCSGSSGSGASTDKGSAPAAAKGESPSKVSLGAGSQGGAYYPVGVGLADVMTKNVSGLTVTPEVTGAASENMVLLGNGEIGVGITTVSEIYKGQAGEKPYDKKYTNVSLMFAGIKPGAVQIAVPANSPIKSIADLKGKKIGVGPQGGAGWQAFSEILPYYGFKYEDIKPSYISYDDSVSQLKDGAIDATVIVAGAPTPAVNQLAVEMPFRLLPIDKDKLDAYLKDHPYMARVSLDSKVYPKLTETIDTYATVNVVAVRDAFAEDLVYNMTKAVFEHISDIHNVHASAKAITLESATAYKGFRFHPGAAKYFKEKGIEVPTK